MDTQHSQPGWYLADLVMEIAVDGDPRKVIHVSLTLVAADDADDAFAKATALGTAQEMIYLNPEGKNVRCVFCGIRELTLIFEDLVHGSELSYQEFIEEKSGAAQTIARPKNELAVFRKRESPTGPNYSDAGVVTELNTFLRASGKEGSK